MAKVCLKCGTQIPDDNTTFCPNCGNQLGVPAEPTPGMGPTEGHKSGLVTAAKVLMILSCIATGWLLIPLAWLIPMTVKISHRETRPEKLSSGFKVCVLLFGNMLAGILLLCDNEA